jgi:hypothetical protein
LLLLHKTVQQKVLIIKQPLVQNSGQVAVYPLKHLLKTTMRWSLSVTSIGMVHALLACTKYMKWYVGPGAHVGLYKGITAVGIDGVVGIDYKFTNMPLNLALDWQPSFELGSGTRNGFNANWGGFAIRFTL